MKKARGRPKKPDDQRKAERIELRVETLERDAYVEAAEAAGLDRSEWMRTRLNAAARRESRRA